MPEYCETNAHIFFIKVKDLQTRTALIHWTTSHRVGTPFHYLPLHQSPAGKRFGLFHGEDRYTTRESERLLRLPVNVGMSESELYYVVDLVREFFNK
ncbi:MAG: DegT/DnrJ/EryC1/StrS family aminotransferase [Bdellovibrionota bacterium]